MGSSSRPTYHVVTDPAELGIERTFRNSKRQAVVVFREEFIQYLDDLRFEMRQCLDKSEKARDTYYMLKQAYQHEKGLSGAELERAMDRPGSRAQSAVSDNIMYDRWAAKYAAIIQAEIAYANYAGWDTAS